MTNPLYIAVASAKGGVGKTTVAMGLASVLASSGRRTLVVDLDPEANASFGLGVDLDGPGLVERLSGQAVEPLEAAENLYCFPGGPGLRSVDIVDLDPEALVSALRPLEVDVVIYDCPPGVPELIDMAVHSAQVALIVLDAHPFGIRGATKIVSELSRRQQQSLPGPSEWALVVCRADVRTVIFRSVELTLDSFYPSLSRFHIRQDMSLALSSASREPIMVHAPRSRGVNDLKLIAEWVFSHGKA